MDVEGSLFRIPAGVTPARGKFMVGESKPGLTSKLDSMVSVVEGCLARFEPSPCAGNENFGMGILRNECYDKEIHPDIDPATFRGTFKTYECRWAKKRWRNVVPFVS